MQVVLVMFRGDGDRRSFSIVRDMTVIGRREDCDLRIPVGDVSRKHCRLVMDGETLKVEDLGSSNGTYVNNQRVQEAWVAAGDVIQVGPVQFVVQVDGVPADEDLAAPAQADETAAGEAVLEEITDEPALDEVTLEEAPQELPAEAELSEAELATGHLAGPGEPTIDEPLDAVDLEETPAEEAVLEEAQLEEVQLEEAEDPALPELPTPPAPAPPMVADAELEEVVDLEEVGEEPAGAAGAAPPAAKQAAAPKPDEEWNFVIEEEEETEDDPIADDFHVDLDTPPQAQKQPHR
jgi:pSer/pThr/pTyr-binding forkhead associated (FHA) protein